MIYYQVDGTPSQPRASAIAIAYLCTHQNSKCVPPVLINRAITCDSFKVLAHRKSLGRVVWQSKKGPNILLFDRWWPQDVPQGAKCLHHCILFFITFDLICNMTVCTKWILDPLGATRPWPCPQGLHQNSKYVLQSSSIELLPVKVLRF